MSNRASHWELLLFCDFAACAVTFAGSSVTMGKSSIATAVAACCDLGMIKFLVRLLVKSSVRKKKNSVM